MKFHSSSSYYYYWEKQEREREIKKEKERKRKEKQKLAKSQAKLGEKDPLMINSFEIYRWAVMQS